MTGGDILLVIGLLIGFLFGIPFGIWLSEFSNHRGWK